MNVKNELSIFLPLPYWTIPAAWALTVVTRAVMMAITMSTMRFSVRFLLSVITSSFLFVVM